MNPELQQRAQTYATLHKYVVGLFQSGGVSAVYDFFISAVEAETDPPDLTFMKLTACTRAEGMAIPSVGFLNDLMSRVVQRQDPASDERLELISDMLTQISAVMCHELVTKAMDVARMMAGALGSTIEITAASMGPEDSDWKDLGHDSAGHVLH